MWYSMDNEVLKQILEELKELRQDNQIIKRSVLNLELVEMPRIRVALDGVAANSGALDEHEHRITALEDMTERNAIEITVLKQAK